MRKFGEGGDSVVVSSETRIFLGESTFRDVVEELNLLKDKEVYPGNIVTNDELLVTQKLLNAFHAIGNFYNSIFITRAIAVTGGSTLDVRNDSKHHVNVCLVSIVLSSKVFRAILVSNVAQDCRALSNLDIAINKIWEVGEIKAKCFFD
jgi:hypothetical protein